MRAKTKTRQNSSNKSSGTTSTPRHKAVRAELKDLHKSIEDNYLDMARLLHEAYTKEFYIEWGFEEFRDYCEGELDIHYRKAMYLIGIWDKVTELGLPKSKVKKIGWSKMKDLYTVINEDNAEEWLASAAKMTTREVTEAVKEVRSERGTSRTPSTTTLSFRANESEASIILDAIAEAKKLTENDNDTVALEMICQDWMESQGATPERASIDDIIAYLEKVYGVEVTYRVTGAEEKSSGKKEEGLEELDADDLDLEDILESERVENGSQDGDPVELDFSDDGGEIAIDDLLE